MKKQFFIAVLGLSVAVTGFYSCDKNDETKPQTDFVTLQQNTLNDFVDIVAIPGYARFTQEATALKIAVHALAASPTVANQTAARNAWKAVREIWEHSEGFLIGPVEDNNYDPYMDTWPTDVNSMEALLNGSTPLTVQQLEGYDNADDAAQLALRGFHPLEFLLWQPDVNYDSREIDYMTALADDIYNNVVALQDSWSPSAGNFGQELKNAGQSGSRYTSKKDALLAIAGALTDICGEVGEGKMVDPFLPQPDSANTESPYSHNSLIDFQNNIRGAYDVYRCQFAGQSGISLSDLVAANNKTLDARIKQQFQAAINSFSGFNTTFEQAIYTQSSQVQNTIDAIQSLEETLNTDLTQYLQQYIKN
ncbi:MAG TPA: imelysin family protein [Edaphocola sp.]|nr:imelysin family protein [Edaphocola sp.]